jgi:hypothetical protein
MIGQAHGLSLHEVQRIVDLYRAGKTMQEIASAVDCSWPAVHSVLFDLRRAGVDLPSKKRKRA